MTNKLNKEKLKKEYKDSNQPNVRRNNFITKLNKLYSPEPYDFSAIEYISLSHEVKNAKCDNHGLFNFKPDQIFFTKQLCVHCRRNQPTIQNRIDMSITLWGDKFDYSKFAYINKEIKCTFICKEHQHEFHQLLKNHMKKKNGCIHCASNKGLFLRASNGLKPRTDTIIKKLRSKIRSIINLKLRGKHGTYLNKVIGDFDFQNIVGCSADEFKTYLESKWEPWMSWNNYGLYNGNLDYGWDIDHTIPISSAKTPDEESVIALNHYTNLQPLCSYTNRIIKRAKFHHKIPSEIFLNFSLQKNKGRFSGGK